MGHYIVYSVSLLMRGSSGGGTRSSVRFGTTVALCGSFVFSSRTFFNSVFLGSPCLGVFLWWSCYLGLRVLPCDLLGPGWRHQTSLGWTQFPFLLLSCCGLPQRDYHLRVAFRGAVYLCSWRVPIMRTLALLRREAWFPELVGCSRLRGFWWTFLRVPYRGRGRLLCTVCHRTLWSKVVFPHHLTVTWPCQCYFCGRLDVLRGVGHHSCYSYPLGPRLDQGPW